MNKFDNLIKELINKELEPHGVDFDFVVANERIDGVDWFWYYTMTEDAEKEFKTWAVKRIKEVLKCSKERAEREYSGFSLMYGLKTI